MNTTIVQASQGFELWPVFLLLDCVHWLADEIKFLSYEHTKETIGLKLPYDEVTYDWAFHPFVIQQAALGNPNGSACRSAYIFYPPS